MIVKRDKEEIQMFSRKRREEERRPTRT